MARNNAIQNIVITQITDQFAPPSEEVISICVVAESLFITIDNWSETYDTKKLTMKETYQVDAQAFYDALGVLLADENRSSQGEPA